MASTAVMNSLWKQIQALSLTPSNRKWLADKLIDQTEGKALEKKISEGKREALGDFRQSLVWLQEYKAGKVEGIPFDEGLEQIRKELEAEER